MKTKSILLIIIFISIILRIYNLEKLPASLNPDEAALGYNSYSFLKTGKDEHGKFMPGSLQSFGDWKLPVYSYAAVFPVSLFGLNELSVRLPSAISGVIGVWLIYQISMLIFKKDKIALLAAGFYAFSPWNILFSRAAYEVNLGNTIFLSALLLLLNVIQNSKNHFKNDYFYGFLSALLFALTLFTYHSFIVFTPLFVFSLIIIYKNNFKNKKFILFYLLMFTLLCSLALLNSLSAGSNKITNLLIFKDKDIIYNRVEFLRGDNANKNKFIEQILHNKISGGIYQFAQNYINSFSPAFLFDKGGEKLVHNIGTFGYLYLIDCLFISAGIIFIFRNRQNAYKLLLIWLLTSPIPSALTKDSPNATRLYIMMPLYILLSAYGAYYLIFSFKKFRLKFIISLGLISLYTLNFIYFVDSYYIHFNNHRSRFWRYGQREAVKITNKYPDFKVVFRGPENFPYIYFLFYNAYSPKEFQRSVEYYPFTNEGFLYVKSFDRYQFVEEINYQNLKPKTIYIDDKFSNDSEKIYLPSGESILYYQVIH